MPYVDPSRRVVDATAAQQVARPKMSVIRVDNGDGTYSYYQQVYLANPTAITGPIDVTIGGEEQQVDTVGSDTIPTFKLRLGEEGRDGGLVSAENPVPTRDDELLSLTRQNHELLAALLEELTE